MHSQSPLSQFVYDIWWGQLTPNHEFPAQVRRILNHAFGELAARARRIDLRDVLLLCAPDPALVTCHEVMMDVWLRSALLATAEVAMTTSCLQYLTTLFPSVQDALQIGRQACLLHKSACKPCTHEISFLAVVLLALRENRLSVQLRRS